MGLIIVIAGVIALVVWLETGSTPHNPEDAEARQMRELNKYLGEQDAKFMAKEIRYNHGPTPGRDSWNHR